VGHSPSFLFQNGARVGRFLSLPFPMAPRASLRREGPRQYQTKKGTAKRWALRYGRSRSARANSLAYKRGISSASAGGYARIGAGVTSNNPGGAFPPVLNTKLTFAGDVALNPLVGSYSSNTWSANSLYDPDVSGAGNQPRYFDTLFGAGATNAPYNHYLVKGCKAEGLFRNSSDFPVMIAMGFLPASASVPPDGNTAREMSNVVTAWLGSKNSGSSIGQLNMYRRIGDVLGVKDVEDDAELRSAYNNNPTNRCYVFTAVYNTDGAATGSVLCNARLVYYSQALNLNTVGPS